MPRVQKYIRLFLVGCLLLALVGCGASSGTDAITTAFTGQSSVQCTLTYSITLDAVIDGMAYDGLTQVYTADAEVDLTTGNCYLLGDIETSQDGDRLSSAELECYVIPDDGDAAYYRHGETYYAGDGASSFSTILLAPLSLNLDGYVKNDEAELLSGSVCDVYTGTEIADDSEQVYYSALTRETTSLAGCLMDVTLRVYADSSLPAQLVIQYSNLDEMAPSFTDSQGNSYLLTDLRYEVCYTGYGATLSVTVPDGFRQLALQDDGASTTLGDSGEDDDGDVTDEGTYLIYNDDGSYSFEIATPDYMALQECGRHAVSFYYFYADDDFETIEYTVCDDFTGDDEANYALALADYYQLNDSISNVSSGEVQSITTGGYDVQYIVITLTLTQDGVDNEVVNIYSWAEAPNGADCLEVNITEYNSSGDGTFIDAVTELQYAYASVLQCSTEG